RNERMGGSVPMWVRAETARQSAESVLSAAQAGRPAQKNSVALAYSPQQESPASDTSFGFADLLDMVNPLQHIPVVGTIYREVTRDTIRPSGKIIGGAVFGGPIGAASSLVNVIIEAETGRDIAGNALALVSGSGNRPGLSEDPENRLNRAVRIA